jgi:diphthine synthase
MLYLIGLGLNEKGISLEGIELAKKCECYLEGYTVDFPYSVAELEKVVGKRIQVLKREEVESDEIVKEAAKKDVCLLIYGSPLFATTHIALLQECIEQKVQYKIVYAASIYDAIAETGLQMYKFGKTTSLPKWSEKHKPESFVDIVKENKGINAHTLVLVDMGLEFNNALNQLIEACNGKVEINEIVVCSNLGTEKAKIFYGNVKALEKMIVEKPFCFIIPGELHFLESEFLNRFRVK